MVGPGASATALRAILEEVGAYSRALLPGYALRRYQLEPAGPIIDSIRQGRGRQFALVFARQSGKYPVASLALGLAIWPLVALAQVDLVSARHSFGRGDELAL